MSTSNPNDADAIAVPVSVHVMTANDTHAMVSNR